MSSTRADTREKILQATLNLLEASQGEGVRPTVRMSDIAKQAGITRQALYLHFATRADLLIATTFYLDDKLGAATRLAPSRAAETGVARLEAFIEAWGNYIPEIYGIAKALLAMKDSDEAAAKAWGQRMQDLREGCAAATAALQRDGQLSPAYSEEEATDLLWTLLSVRTWEQLTQDCGWPQARYLESTKAMAQRLFVA